MPLCFAACGVVGWWWTGRRPGGNSDARLPGSGVRMYVHVHCEEDGFTHIGSGMRAASLHARMWAIADIAMNCRADCVEGHGATEARHELHAIAHIFSTNT